MLVQRARFENWKKWAAKHEYEELKEGTWLGPMQATLRRRIELWTGKHRNVMRNFWRILGAEKTTRRRLKKCQVCNKDKGTEKHRLYPCPCWKGCWEVWMELGSPIEETIVELGATSKNVQLFCERKERRIGLKSIGL